MSIETKFNLGDKVWRIIDQRRYISVDCDICNCTGKVSIKGKNFDCPNCHGEGHLKSLETSDKIVGGPFEIGRIDVSVCNTLEYFNSENYQFNANKDFSTSARVGSGIFLQAEDIFATKEEAIEKANTVF